MQKIIDYEKELNPAQLEAVKSTQGAYLVIAGAGSGKTRTLVFRVAYLVEKGVAPDEILLLTFTRKAAEEMLRRASLLLDERCRRVSGGTFHSFANSILRKYARVLGIQNNFSILDESDAEDTVNLIRTKLGFDKMDKRFPRKKAILEVISKSINKSEELGTVLYDEYPQFIEWEEEIKKIQQEYVKFKRVKSLLDYDDLLVFLKELLTQHEQIRLSLSQKYKYIMVDEYQDTNKLQAHITCLLSSVHGNIMVVGDDSQSIYSFRGANFKNIIDFPKIFKDAKVITLEENYRSTQPILNLANEIISSAKEKFEKTLFTKKNSKKLPIFVDAPNEHAQSRYIADKILELREEGVELGEMAVLFRSSWHSNDLEVELTSRNIPFVKYGGQKFVEAAHIKDVLSFLRIKQNISDEVSWYRVLLLMRGIGPKTAAFLINEIILAKKSMPQENKRISGSEDLKNFFNLFKKIETEEHSPAQLIRFFLDYYQPLLREKYDDFHRRLNDLDSLERIATRYDVLEEFLADMALEPPERNIVESGIRDKDDQRFILSTIHSAKGLEWRVVFLIYVAEGHIPSYLSLEDEDELEEERRLFYVAITRAKDELYFLKPHLDRSPRGGFDAGGMVFTQISRFLDRADILDKLVLMENLRNDDFEDTDLEDIIGENRSLEQDKDFLKTIEEYFN